MTIMDSLFPTIHGDAEDGGELETENCVFLQLLDEVCSDQDFFRKVELKLNIDYLDSVLSPDPAPLDPLALEKQEREVGSTLDCPDFLNPELLNFSSPEIQEVAPWEQPQPPSAPCGRPPPVSTQKAEKPDSPVSSDAVALDFVPLREPKQEALEAILKELSHQLSDHSRSDRVPDETPNVEERARTDPNHSGQKAAPSETKEEVPLTDATTDFFGAINAACGLCSTANSLTSATDTLASDPEAADRDTLAASSAADDGGPTASEDASVSVQSSQAIRSGPSASESPSTSSVAGSTRDHPAPRPSADLLTGSRPRSASPPALKVQAWKTLSSLHMKKSEEQQSPRNINPNSSSPLKDKSHATKDNAVTSPACASFVTDSHPDLLEKSARTSASRSKTAIEAREEETTGLTSERREENREDDTELVQIRCQQPLNRGEKEGLRNEVKKKDGEEWRPSEESFNKTPTCSGDESSIEERSHGNKTTPTALQFSEMAKKDGYRKLTGDLQTITVEAGERGDGVRVENTLSTETPQEKSERDEGRVKEREEGVQIRVTPLPAARDGREIQQPETERRSDEEERSEKANKDSTAREADEETVRGNRSPVSPPASSFLQSPRAQTSTHPIKEAVTVVQGSRRAPEEEPLDQRDECGRPGSSLESKTAETCEKIPAAETTHRKSAAKLSTDQRADVKAEEAERPHRTRSLMRRYRQEHGAPEETESGAHEAEEEEAEREVLGSPMKRRKWKSKVEAGGGDETARRRGRGVRRPSTEHKE